MKAERSPGWKLFLAGIIGVVLVAPLLMVYGLVWDRQAQSDTAQNTIAEGWGGPQVIVGPVLVVPYRTSSVETVEENGRQTTRTVSIQKELFLSPVTNAMRTELKPERKKKSIYESVLFVAQNSGTAHFALPNDFERFGIARTSIDFSGAEIRFGVSDARGLQKDSRVEVNGVAVNLQPGKGLAASKGSGFFSFVDWTNPAPLEVRYNYSVRGNKSLAMVPRGGETTWDVRSSWPSPSFGGDFLPTKRDVKTDGFTSSHAVTNLALGQSILVTHDADAPIEAGIKGNDTYSGPRPTPVAGGPSQVATIGLIEPVDLYSQVDRSVKYGFLFIGFTFLAFLMFDLVGGARVAAAEYLLAGAALVLLFVLLLAFAEVTGFMWSYLLAAGAITGLLTAYSAAVLKSWRRARLIGALLAGLYATLYVLLNLEAFSLLIGSMMLFIALAVVMWTTRSIDW
ncbi:MAG: cell envelope integrity protein CreD, partial [Sphingorhabdus sp.]